MMDKQSKWLLLCFFIIILASVHLSYERTIVRKDFETFDSEEELLEEEAPLEDASVTSEELLPAASTSESVTEQE